MRPGQFSDGAWDCRHAYDPGEHRDAWLRLGCPTDPEAAINVVREAWGDDADVREDWLAQHAADVIADSRGTVDPCDEYLAWRAEWQACAVAYVRSAMPGWRADEQERRASKKENP